MTVAATERRVMPVQVPSRQALRAVVARLPSCTTPSRPRFAISATPERRIILKTLAESGDPDARARSCRRFRFGFPRAVPPFMTACIRSREQMAARTCLAIVLAAGEGTRMRSLRPKVLHALAGKSLLAHALSAVSEATAVAVVI